tara:strand:+ start:753 stop:1508 length:756 start_codon:yes stop_codon:yes gene_type:complete
MKLIDTHCHIYYDNFKNDFDEVLKRSKQNSISKLICVGVDIESSKKSINLSEKFSQIFATVGYHPHESKEAPLNYLLEIKNLLKSKKVVAIGEIGLDYYYNHSDKKTQNKIFIEQLELAKEIDKPVVIHCRDAEDDIIKGLKKVKNNYGVVHCFSGTEEFAKKLFELGFYVSFTGMITFKNELPKLIEKIPIEKIMIETDSPYLTPVPNRGKRNEPAMVKIVAEKIAEIKNISLNEVAKITTKNAEKLFGI